jgi:flavin-dependent dehydrogenase
LIGDAAGYLDAITGEGISLALAQALSLDTTVVPLLQDAAQPRRRLTTQDLQTYAHAYQTIVKPYYRVTHLVLTLSRYPAIAARIIRALGQRPEVFQHFLSANMGLVSPWSLGMRNAAGFLGALCYA